MKFCFNFSLINEIDENYHLLHSILQAQGRGEGGKGGEGGEGVLPYSLSGGVLLGS